MNWYRVYYCHPLAGTINYAVKAESPENALKRWTSFQGYLETPSRAGVEGNPLTEVEVETIYNKMR